MRYVNKVKNSCFETYATLKNLDKIDKTEFKAHSLGGGSPQGLIDDINHYKKQGATSFAIQDTEFGRTLQSIQKGFGYMAGLDDLYCRLWTGEYYLESFSRRSNNKDKSEPRELTEGTYFSIFGTMQKLKNYITSENLSFKGTMRRMSIFAIDGKDVLDYYRPPLGRNIESLDGKLQNLGVRLGENMFELEKEKRPILIEYDDETKNYLNKYDEKLTRLAKQNDEDPYYLYQQGLFEQTCKFGMHIVISNDNRELVLEDVLKAQKQAEQATEKVRVILEEELIPHKQKQRRKNIERMIMFVRKHNPTKRELQQRMGSIGVVGQEYRDFLELGFIKLEGHKYVVNE
jgi:hypothetical protein